MNAKKILFNTIFFISIIAFAAVAYAQGNEYNLYSLEQGTDNPLSQVDASFFMCNNVDNICNEINIAYGQQDFNSGSGNLIAFEAAGTPSPANYAFYFYKDGYIPMKGRILGDWGYGYIINHNIFFTKKASCKAPIVGFDFYNAVYQNEPIQFNISAQLDAETASAFVFTDTPPYYRPDEFFNSKRYLFEATTLVEVRVYDNEDNLIHYDNQTKDIYAEETELFQFTWVPTQYGENFKVIVTANVVDDQCSSYVPVNAQEIFDILPERPRNTCYTLLRDLEYYPAHPIVEETIDVNVDRLSNYADGNSVKTPIGTLLDIIVRKGKSNPSGDIVASQTYDLPATASESIFETTLYDFVVTSADGPGWYTIYVNGSSNSILCNGNDITSELSTEIYIAPIPTHTYTIYVRDGQWPNNFLQGVLVNFEEASSQYTNAQGYAQFTDLQPDTYSYNLGISGYLDYFGQVSITNADKTETVYMERTQCYDNIDNDGDGYIDYPDDLGCDSIDDNDESDGFVRCNLNSECGTVSSINYCNGNNYMTTTTTPTCYNAGTEQSYCQDYISSETENCKHICDDSLGCDYTECSDGLDNDNDNYIDYPDDLGCSDYLDDDESDGFISCSADIDCGTPSTVGKCDGNSSYDTTTTTPTCYNAGTEQSYCEDLNDTIIENCNYICSDSLGCDYTECSDGLDNDNDNYIDYPDDLGCSDYLDDDESDGFVRCNSDSECGTTSSVNYCDGNDYMTTTTTPTCYNAGTEQSYCQDYISSETKNCKHICDDNLGCDYTECSDGLDNDNDNYIDYPDDLGCSDYLDDDESDGFVRCNSDSECGTTSSVNYCDGNDYMTTTTTPTCYNAGTEQSYCQDYISSETKNCKHICDDNLGCDYTECSDGLDNDNDNYIDYPDDLGCSDYLDDDESDGFVRCNSDSECGTTSSVNYCDGNDYMTTTTTPTCYNAGTEQSYCEDLTDTIIENCNYICSDSLGCDYTECSDGLDNDNDNYIDYPDDVGCDNYYDNNESDDEDFDIPPLDDKSVLGITRFSIINDDYLRPGDTLFIIATLENNGDVNLDNIRLTFTILELDMRRRIGPFDLKKNEGITKLIILDIPYWAEPGYYDIRATASNGDIRRIKHREIVINN